MYYRMNDNKTKLLCLVYVGLINMKENELVDIYAFKSIKITLICIGFLISYLSVKTKIFYKYIHIFLHILLITLNYTNKYISSFNHLFTVSLYICIYNLLKYCCIWNIFSNVSNLKNIYGFILFECFNNIINICYNKSYIIFSSTLYTIFHILCIIICYQIHKLPDKDNIIYFDFISRNILMLLIHNICTELYLENTEFLVTQTNVLFYLLGIIYGIILSKINPKIYFLSVPLIVIILYNFYSSNVYSVFLNMLCMPIKFIMYAPYSLDGRIYAIVSTDILIKISLSYIKQFFSIQYFVTQIILYVAWTCSMFFLSNIHIYNINYIDKSIEENNLKNNIDIIINE